MFREILLPVRRSVVLGLGVAILAGCGDPLDVDLDVITPASAVYAWAGSGLLSDELINARNGFERIDQRNIDNNASPNTTAWSGFAAVMYSGPRAVRALRQYVADSPTRSAQIAEIYALRGLGLAIGGEIFCNGVPFSYLQDDGSKVYDTKSYMNADLFTLAVTYADSALSVAPAGSAVRNLARVVKARALLDLNRTADAATVVRAGGDGAGSAAIANAFAYSAEYSATTITNGPYDWMPSSANFGTPNGSETPNTMDWRDPRIGVRFFRTGQDGVTPVYVPGTISQAQAVSSPFPLATGIEARLIEAEAALKVGDASWLTTLNQLRSSSTLAAQLPPLVDPVAQAARVDLVFKERAMWMYLTIHRLGDLRRLVKQYGRTVDQVFPTGAYFKGGTYGTSVAMEPSLTETTTHPHWKGCTDRLP
jgi:starch-binding outer membrane protein, SusD/RagB family